jgi:hypothetical protein
MQWRGLYYTILWFSLTALLTKILGYLLPWWFVARQQDSTIDRYFIGVVFGLDCVNGIEQRNCTEYSIGRSPAQIAHISISIFFLIICSCVFTKKGEGVDKLSICIVTATNIIIFHFKNIKDYGNCH